GWLPLLPYFFKYIGQASQIYTYDLNRHFHAGTIKKLNNKFSKKFSLVVSESQNPYHLPEDIEYFPNTNLIDEDNIEADIVFSRFVLEHVTPQDMELMHKKFKSSLKPGSHIVHFIS